MSGRRSGREADGRRKPAPQAPFRPWFDLGVVAILALSGVIFVALDSVAGAAGWNVGEAWVAAAAAVLAVAVALACRHIWSHRARVREDESERAMKAIEYEIEEYRRENASRTE